MERIARFGNRSNRNHHLEFFYQQVPCIQKIASIIKPIAGVK